MIAQETIDAVLDRADIVQVVKRYVSGLVKRGANFVACCPFHSEKTPSFHVSPVRQSWHCFGQCQEGGNVITFVMKVEGLTFPQAIEKLAKEYGVECMEAEEVDAEREKRLHREALWGLNERVAEWFGKNLYADTKEAKEALAYARERFGRDYVTEAGLGLAPAKGDALAEWAFARGESIDLLMELGLVGRDEKRGTFYDFYRGRLVFPIRDRRRNVLGFTARDISGRSEAKYLNSKESAAYRKKYSVFGLDVAWKQAMKDELFYLVEGAPDAAKLQSVGINNAVAPLGGAWTGEQLDELRRVADCVCFINDADPPKEGEEYGAGIAYVLKSGRLALEKGFSVTVREIPLGEGRSKQDPGSFFTDRKKLKLLQEEEFVTWAARKWWKSDDNTNRKSECITSIAELASFVRDETRIEMLLDELVKIRKGREFWRSAINRAKWAREDKRKQEAREVNLRVYGFMEDRGCYYGLTDKGEVQWSNFTMRPLFHIRDNDRPRRLFELRGARQKMLLDLDMEELNSLQKFRKKLEGLGNYIWMAGDQEMVKLKMYLYDQTETAQLVTQLGWNPHGFYAWGNGIWRDGDFMVADENGVVRLGEGDKPDNWFIPSAAKAGEPGAYERQRKFVHRPAQKVRFAEYMEQFVAVHGDNGKIGLCYWLASLFRDIVMAATKSFPLLNLFGPKGSGKTQLGAALMTFFVVDNKAPNLKNSTPSALNDDVAYVADALVHFDEYKNDLHPKMIEFLKGMYDGVGRTKMGGANFGDRKMTAVNAGVIVSGQEIPTADIALFHRCVFLSFTRSEFTLAERQRFADLHSVQQYGLTDLTLSALALRRRVQGNFTSAYDEVCRLIAETTHNAPLETRLVENWAKLLAVFRCVEGRLQFPFTFDELMGVAVPLLQKQNAMSGEGNELAHFWQTIMFLRDNGQLYEKGDFHVKTYTEITTDIVQHRLFPEPRKVLLLNTSRVFALYKEAARRSGDKIIPDDALREYLKHNDCYLGTLKSVRFSSFVNGYEERKADGTATMRSVSRIQRAMAFDYEMLQRMYGISLESFMDVEGVTCDNDSGQRSKLPF